MLFFFFTDNGYVWTYDTKDNVTNCTLYYDYHIIEGNYIYFMQKDGEVIEKCKLYSFELFDKII